MCAETEETVAKTTSPTVPDPVTAPVTTLAAATLEKSPRQEPETLRKVGRNFFVSLHIYFFVFSKMIDKGCERKSLEAFKRF